MRAIEASFSNLIRIDRRSLSPQSVAQGQPLGYLAVTVERPVLGAMAIP